MHSDHSRQHLPGMHTTLVIKWAVRLVAMGVFLSIVFCYPEKGHSHGPIDGCFGQMCVKLSLAEFDDDSEFVAILHEFLMSSGLDSGSREGARAYKLDMALSGSSGPRWLT